MLKRIHLKNYAKHKDLELNFSDGLTAICGKNGGGKTLIVEAVSFALFGSKELRGSKSDYASDMSVELDIEIKGKPYKIVRTLDNCKINDLVVGTTECNKFITALLGFGSDVYNFSIYSKQGDLTRLTDVAPAERKACIDALIGAKQIDNVIKNVRAELNSYKAKAAAFQTTLDNLPKQVAPTKPGYDRSEVEAQLKKVRELETCLKSARVSAEKLNRAPAIEPEAPTAPEEVLSPEEIVNLRNRVSELNARLQAYSDLNAEIAVAGIEEKEIPSDEERARQFRLIETYVPVPDCPKPTMTLEEIAAESSAWHTRKAWEKAPKTTCPKCGHVFASESEPEIPAHSEKELSEELRRVQAWTGVPENVESLEKPKYTLKQLQDFADAKRRYIQRANLSVDGIEDLPILRNQLAANESYRTKLERFASEKRIYDDFVSRKEELDTEIARLHTELSFLPDEAYLEKAIYDWTNYELQLKLFDQNEATRHLIEKDQSEAAAMADKYDSALAGLIEFKRRVKTFVIPSLESVASQMISEMSAGELNRFEISEDFDILLDGKKICLLSGSEKALANIALRLSLGRVLTRGVLSLFIADEIDASMSEERAEEVHSALMRLRDGGKLRQILVITHKSLECDKEIEVGK